MKKHLPSYVVILTIPSHRDIPQHDCYWAHKIEFL